MPQGPGHGGPWRCRFYHADPHPGNILRMTDGRLCYLDFGMMGHIDRPTRQALIRATLHMVNREFEELANDFVTLGLLPEDSEATVEEVTAALQGAPPAPPPCASPAFTAAASHAAAAAVLGWMRPCGRARRGLLLANMRGYFRPLVALWGSCWRWGCLRRSVQRCRDISVKTNTTCRVLQEALWGRSAELVRCRTGLSSRSARICM